MTEILTVGAARLAPLPTTPGIAGTRAGYRRPGRHAGVTPAAIRTLVRKSPPTGEAAVGRDGFAAAAACRLDGLAGPGRGREPRCRRGPAQALDIVRAADG